MDGDTNFNLIVIQIFHVNSLVRQQEQTAAISTTLLWQRQTAELADWRWRATGTISRIEGGERKWN